VVDEFGEGLLTAEGELDRPAMADLVFSDEAARRRLEAIVHPLVFERIVEIEAAAGADQLVVHDIPLLAESGRADTFDAVVVVDVPVETAVRRIVENRGGTEAEAMARIGAQATREQRLAVATHVLDNSGTPAELRDQVERLHAELASA
jgi:dephospho-CoA kinase